MTEDDRVAIHAAVNAVELTSLYAEANDDPDFNIVKAVECLHDVLNGITWVR